jgi:hypothetical protein
MSQNNHNQRMNVVMDTNYWICFEKNQSLYNEFLTAKQQHGFTVTYTRSNFEDMANTDNQNSLSNVIAATADTYVAVDNYNTDEYYRETDPVVLAHPDSREKFQEFTKGLDDAETLKFMFRGFEQDPDPSFPALVRKIKQIYDEHGRDRAIMNTFGTKVQRDGDRLFIDFEDVGNLEFIRKMLAFEHAVQIKDEENIKSQDYLDMEISAHAILESDVFLSESKWKDAGIVSSVCKYFENFDGPIVIDGFDAFFEAVSKVE